MRFGVLRRSVGGISARLLTVRLRELEVEGFVDRTVVRTIPPEVTYTPTVRLRDLQPIMRQLQSLCMKWATENEPVRHDERVCGLRGSIHSSHRSQRVVVKN